MTNDILQGAPAEQLRDRFTRGRGRLAVIPATSSVWLMDLLRARHIHICGRHPWPGDYSLSRGMATLICVGPRLSGVLHFTSDCQCVGHDRHSWPSPGWWSE
jgi:hypothetical protein